jgi:hypothetical protein
VPAIKLVQIRASDRNGSSPQLVGGTTVDGTVPNPDPQLVGDRDWACAHIFKKNRLRQVIHFLPGNAGKNVTNFGIVV